MRREAQTAPDLSALLICNFELDPHLTLPCCSALFGKPAATVAPAITVTPIVIGWHWRRLAADANIYEEMRQSAGERKYIKN